jgi:hypothetical protein
MQVHLFVSTTYASVRAFTSDPTGDNLPPDYAPWRPFSTGDAVPVQKHTQHVADAVARHGYFLVSGRVQRLHLTRAPKLPRGPNQLAKLIVDLATDEVEDKKDTALTKRAAKAGARGGPARSEALMSESLGNVISDIT